MDTPTLEQLRIQINETMKHLPINRKTMTDCELMAWEMERAARELKRRVANKRSTYKKAP